MNEVREKVHLEIAPKLKRIANHFGEMSQLMKLSEELGELIVASQKIQGESEEILLRNLIEESADVVILIMQNLYLQERREEGVFDLFWAFIEQKINRQIERIESEKEKKGNE